MKVALAALPEDRAARVCGKLRRLLRQSGEHQSRWRELVVVVTPDEERVIPRLQFASELRAAGLERAAHECVARRVGANEVLAYVLRDDENVAGVVFLVVDLRSRASA